MRFIALFGAGLALAGCGIGDEPSPPPAEGNAVATVNDANVLNEDVELDPDSADPVEENTEALYSGDSVEGVPVEPTLDPAGTADTQTPSANADEALASAEKAVDNARAAVEQASNAPDGQ